MDIRNWGLNRIMQLPDSCFGRRFAVYCHARGTTGNPAWDIAEIALPETVVLWELQLLSSYPAWDVYNSRLALGDRLPIATAEMDVLEPLIHGMGITGAEPRTIPAFFQHQIHLRQLRQPIRTAGRRLVLEVTPAPAKSAGLSAVCVFSGIPTEAPDWLVSG